jgi:EAL domain-containing protein (putative c-di-GMP-specific phosphodiesterase class I)
MKTVAEGVELREDWNLLHNLNCEVVQGFFVSKPLSHAEVLAFPKSWRP